MPVLKAGTRLKSAVCETQIMVIKAGPEAVEIGCGGAPMTVGDAPSSGAAIDPAHAEGTLVGKRYVDPTEKWELLCTKGGQGGLTFNGAPMAAKVAKALPSSD